MPENPNLPQPDAELKRLDRFVGSWTMEGHLLGSDETGIRGEATFCWLAGGFFLEQHMRMDFVGIQMDSLELIGYDPESNGFPSTVYSNLAPGSAAVQLEHPGRHREHHCRVSAARCHLHRLLARERHIPGRLAAEPRRRRDRQRAIQHQRRRRR